MNKNLKKVLNDIKNGKKRAIWVDVDGTIADTKSTKYGEADPDVAMIAMVNMLYDRGCEIYIVTARGGKSEIDWRAKTEDQLTEWGVHYHRLIIGIPKDLYLGDEAISPEDFLNEVE